jgi:protein-L-isoaspartate(D-aspartate) O-methyltransferase
LIENVGEWKHSGTIGTGNWVSREGAIALSLTHLDYALYSFIFLSFVRPRLLAISHLETTCVHILTWPRHMKGKNAALANFTLMIPTRTPTRRQSGFEMRKAKHLFGSRSERPTWAGPQAEATIPGENAAMRVARRRYAEELKYVAHIKSEAIVRAFAKVPREAFLGAGPWKIPWGKGDWTTEDGDPKHLYHNVLVSVDPARGLNNGMPSFLAFLIDALELKAEERVAHIGCGTGYYSAILAEVVGKKGRVTSVEIDHKLAARAKRNLLPWRQVSVMAADGSRCRLDTVDALLVNAGATHPAAIWLDALAAGGRMVIPLTIDNCLGRVLKVTRLTTGYSARFIGEVGIFPCVGARSRRANHQLKAAFQSGTQDAVRSVRRDQHKPNRMCWLHGTNFCLSRTAVSD